VKTNTDIADNGRDPAPGNSRFSRLASVKEKYSELDKEFLLLESQVEENPDLKIHKNSQMSLAEYHLLNATRGRSPDQWPFFLVDYLKKIFIVWRELILEIKGRATERDLWAIFVSALLPELRIKMLYYAKLLPALAAEDFSDSLKSFDNEAALRGSFKQALEDIKNNRTRRSEPVPWDKKAWGRAEYLIALELRQYVEAEADKLKPAEIAYAKEDLAQNIICIDGEGLLLQYEGEQINRKKFPKGFHYINILIHEARLVEPFDLVNLAPLGKNEKFYGNMVPETSAYQDSDAPPGILGRDLPDDLQRLNSRGIQKRIAELEGKIKAWGGTLYELRVEQKEALENLFGYDFGDVKLTFEEIKRKIDNLSEYSIDHREMLVAEFKKRLDGIEQLEESIAEAENEIEQIRHYQSKDFSSIDSKGRLRSRLSQPGDKARQDVKKAIGRALDWAEKQGYPKIVAHLRESVRYDPDSHGWIYNPPKDVDPIRRRSKRG